MYEIPAFWRRLFWIEVVLCVFTPLLWWFAPASYLEDFLGVSADSASHRYLLIQAGGVVLSAWGYLLGMTLWSRRVPAAMFNRLQEAMCLGDVVLLVATPWAIALQPQTALLVAQTVLAAGWMTARLVYLARVGWRHERRLRNATAES